MPLTEKNEKDGRGPPGRGRGLTESFIGGVGVPGETGSLSDGRGPVLEADRNGSKYWKPRYYGARGQTAASPGKRPEASLREAGARAAASVPGDGAGGGARVRGGGRGWLGLNLGNCAERSAAGPPGKGRRRPRKAGGQ